LSNFQQRTITAAFFAIVMLCGISINSITFFIVFLVVTTLGLWEFYTLSYKDNVKPQKYLGTFIGIIIFVTNYLLVNKIVNTKIFLLYIPLILLILITELYRKTERPFANIATTIFGIIYIAVPFSFFNYIVHPSLNGGLFSRNILLGFVLLIWTNDTGAYLVGKNFGKRRLFERISPKKTWEGSIGGLALTLLIAWFLSKYFVELNLENWLIIASIIVLIGTYGDLVESLFKRSIDIKDSGTILPGHGGILDRFDSMLLASPLVFAYIEFIQT